MEELYRRRIERNEVGRPESQSFWRVGGRVIKITIRLGKWSYAHAQILTLDGTWTFLERIYNSSVDTVFVTEDEEPCFEWIEKMAMKDEAKLLDLVKKLLIEEVEIE